MPDKLMMVPVENVRPAEDNVRSDLGDVSELADSIERNGLIEPIRVQADGRVDGAQLYKVVAGHRRLAACELLHADGRLPGGEMQVLVQAKAADEDRVAAMLVENLHRADLNPVDQMRGFVRLVDQFGWSTADVAQRCAVSPALVKSRVSWVKLPDHVLAAVRDRFTTIELADRLARLPVAAISELTAKDRVPVLHDITVLERRRAGEAKEAKFAKRVAQAGGFVSTQRAMKHMLDAHESGDTSPPPATFPPGSAEVWKIVSAMTNPAMRYCSPNHEPSPGQVFTATANHFGDLEVRLLAEAAATSNNGAGDGGVEDDEERYEGMSPGEIAFEKAHDEWRAVRDDINAQRKDLLDAAKRDLIASKPAVLIEHVLRNTVNSNVTLYNVVKVGELLGVQATRDQAGIDLVYSYAATSATHLARTAMACMISSNRLPDGVLDVELPEPPPPPKWSDYNDLDEADEADEDVDDVEDVDEAAGDRVGVDEGDAA